MMATTTSTMTTTTATGKTQGIYSASCTISFASPIQTNPKSERLLPRLARLQKQHAKATPKIQRRETQIPTTTTSIHDTQPKDIAPLTPLTPISAPLTTPSNLSLASPTTRSNRHTCPPLRRQPSSTYLPVPSSENNFLNFCPGACQLQNGDQNALKCNFSRRSSFRKKTPSYACTSHGCGFREEAQSGSGFSTLSGNEEKSVGKAATGEVFEQRGIRFRPAFLAKSHMSYAKAPDGLSRFQCMFCAFRGVFKFEVLVGVDALLAHVATHRKDALDLEPAVIDRARCVVGKRARDDEAFDINLVPVGQAKGELSRDNLSFTDWATLKHVAESESEGDRLIRAISLSQIRPEPEEPRMGFLEWIKNKVDEEHMRPTEWPGLA